MSTPKNLEEAKPIQVESFDLEGKTEDSINYLIKISTSDDKLTLSSSFKKGLICKEYFSSYEVTKLCENLPFTFKTLKDYLLFLKDILENNKAIKLENKIKVDDGALKLTIPVKLGVIKEINFEIKEKELNEKEIQNNIIDFINKLYLENEELKQKVKDLEESSLKNIERIKNLFKDSTIVKEDEKK